MQYPLLYDWSDVLLCHQHILWWFFWFMDLLLHPSTSVPYSLPIPLYPPLFRVRVLITVFCCCLHLHLGVWAHLNCRDYSSFALLNCPLSSTLGTKIVSFFFLDVIWLNSQFCLSHFFLDVIQLDSQFSPLTLLCRCYLTWLSHICRLFSPLHTCVTHGFSLKIKTKRRGTHVLHSVFTDLLLMTAQQNIQQKVYKRRTLRFQMWLVNAWQMIL